MYIIVLLIVIVIMTSTSNSRNVKVNLPDTVNETRKIHVSSQKKSLANRNRQGILMIMFEKLDCNFILIVVSLSYHT